MKPPERPGQEVTSEARSNSPIMRRITTHWYEWPWRDPGAAARVVRSADPDLVCLQEFPRRVRPLPRLAAFAAGLDELAALPDITFFFKATLETSLQRILDGRPQLKYFEAGMDLRLSSDPYESFRIFQGRILQEYQHVVGEYGLTEVDATHSDVMTADATWSAIDDHLS